MDEVNVDDDDNKKIKSQSTEKENLKQNNDEDYVDDDDYSPEAISSKAHGSTAASQRAHGANLVSVQLNTPAESLGDSVGEGFKGGSLRCELDGDTNTGNPAYAGKL